MSNPAAAQELLQHINARYATGFRLVHRYAAGQHGAYRIADDSGQSFVLKWSPRLEHLQLFEAAVRVTTELRALGYPAPRYRLWGIVGDTCFSIQDRLDGRPGPISSPKVIDQLVALNDLHAARGGWLRETFSRRPAWSEEVVHAVLHGYPEHDYCVLESLRTWSSTTSELLGQLQQLVARHTEDVARVNCTDVVHYDFSPANTLLVGEHVTGVVDWEGVRAGDRVFDLATLLFYTAAVPELRRRLQAALLARSSPSMVGVYLAHLIVRQLDFSIRHHTPAAVDGWLRHIRQLLEDGAFLTLSNAA